MGEMGRIEVLAVMKRYYQQLVANCKPSEARSTSLWAVEELSRYIVDNPGENPYELILKFSDKMDIWSCKNLKTSQYFSEARAIALDIYDECGGR